MSAMDGQFVVVAGGGSSSFDPERARHRRIVLIILATVMMGVADLLCTMTYMSSVGMIELNPLARLMISIGGSEQLVRFKVFTMVLSAGALYLCRRTRNAEFWALLCAGIMLALMVHWLFYNEMVQTMTHEISVLAASSVEERPPSWVMLTE